MWSSDLPLVDTPWGSFKPAIHGFGSSSGCFIGVACGAGIGNFVLVHHSRGDECEGVRTDFYVGDGGRDFGQVAGDATAACGIFFVVSMLFDGSSARAVQRKWTMAIHTNLVVGFCAIVRSSRCREYRGK